MLLTILWQFLSVIMINRVDNITILIEFIKEILGKIVKFYQSRASCIIITLSIFLDWYI